MSTTIIDVRTAEEFGEGHLQGSKNIPLHEIAERVNELKAITEPLILCCASGGRSSMAVQYLSQQGIQCSNGGSWRNLQFEINNTNK